MSPDLEWRVDDPSGEQTIAKTTPPRPPRWRKWAIGLVVMLGVGLGVIYRSIPEPTPPAPTPTVIPSPTPTAMPAALYKTIAREAQALATGDRATFKQLLDVQDSTRYTEMTSELKAWGTPTDGALYSILDFRRSAEDKAWIEIKQFHIDHYMQEIRFYHLRDGEWRRTDFDPSFWSGRTETSETPHFRFTYYIEDYDLIEPMATLLEADYEQICTDFACARLPLPEGIYPPGAYEPPLCAFGYCSGPEECVKALGKRWCSGFPREITITFKMTAQTEQQNNFDIAPNGDLTLTMASLRYLNQIAPPDLEQSLRNPIAWLHVMRLAYGKVPIGGPPPHGRAEVIAIFFREYDNLLKRTGDKPLTMPEEFSQLDTAHLPLLDSLWSETDAINAEQVYAAGNSVIRFIEQEFGWPAIVKFLKAIGPAKSLAEAIETSTGISYVAFEERWRAWATSNTPSVP